MRALGLGSEVSEAGVGDGAQLSPWAPSFLFFFFFFPGAGGLQIWCRDPTADFLHRSKQQGRQAGGSPLAGAARAAKPNPVPAHKPRVFSPPLAGLTLSHPAACEQRRGTQMPC